MKSREGHYLEEYACSQLWGLKAHVLITAEQSIINPVLEYQIPLRLGRCEGILKRLETEIISFRMTHCQRKHFSHYPFLPFLWLFFLCLGILAWKIDENEARLNGVLSLTSHRVLSVGWLGVLFIFHLSLFFGVWCFMCKQTRWRQSLWDKDRVAKWACVESALGSWGQSCCKDCRIHIHISLASLAKFVFFWVGCAWSLGQCFISECVDGRSKCRKGIMVNWWSDYSPATW